MHRRLGRWPWQGVVALVAQAIAHLPAAAAPAPVPPGAPHVVYLDFADGTESLTLAATDDATMNLSSIGAASPYPVFVWPTITTGAITRADFIRKIVGEVNALFLPYNVLITTTRPDAGSYTLVMIGGGPQDLGVEPNVGGIAFMDCGDHQPANVVFAFPESFRGDEHALVITIAQETAHSFGLEHTASLEDVMHPVIVPEQHAFTDEESPVLGTRLCGKDTQNSHRRLLAAVGAWPGDDKPVDDGNRADRTPPELTLIEPSPGAPVGQPFVVRVDALDPSGIDHVVLAVGTDRGVLRHPPFTWSLAGFAVGHLPLTLTAYDASGNVQTLSTVVDVEQNPPILGGCSFAEGPPGGSGAWLLVALGLTAACVCRRRPL